MSNSAVRSKILVTGGTGLLGSALRRYLPDALYVGSRNADLAQLSEVERLFEETSPETVIHMAAWTGGVLWNVQHNLEILEKNARINLNVAYVAKRRKVARFFSLLTGCAFPQNRTGNPLTEDDLHKGDPYEGHLGFAFAKRLLDAETQLVRRQGFAWATVIPVSLFGPNDNFDPERGHVVAGLIRKCVLAKATGGPLEVWGSGGVTRQFLYSDDAARVLARLVSSNELPDRLIIGPEESLTIADLSSAVAAATEFKGEIIFKADKPEGERLRVFQNGRFRALFPDFSFTPLKRALAETAEWYVTQQAGKKP